MIPFLSDLSPTAGALAQPMPNPSSQPQAGPGLDFAGLLGAMLPGAGEAVQGAADAGADAVLAKGELTTALPSAAMTLHADVPRGTILPGPGTGLPDAPAKELPSLLPATSLPPPPLPPAIAPTQDLNAAEVVPAVTEIEAAQNVRIDTMAPADASSEASAQSDPAPTAAPQSVPIIDVSHAASALALKAVAAVPASPAPNPINASPRTLRHPAAPPTLAEDAPQPLTTDLLAGTSAGDTGSAKAAAAPSAPPGEGAGAAPTMAGNAPTPTPTPAALTAISAAPAPESASAPRPPAPQQDTTIAQVGELREALRATRPELTLRHAEFGAVSLRIEAAGADGWRAVLSARDLGFVPAIQAALAERAAAAASASADTAPQGSSDQRYGSSPGSGQSGSQPYSGQSQSRDENAAHRPQQPAGRTADRVAARAAEAEAEAGDPRAGGVFA